MIEKGGYKKWRVEVMITKTVTEMPENLDELLSNVLEYPDTRDVDIYPVGEWSYGDSLIPGEVESGL